jgi:hypothetical protein
VSESRRVARRPRAVLAAIVLITALPATAAGAEPGHPNPSVEMVSLVPGVQGEVIALINSGQVFDGIEFEGIPDGIGLAPARRGDDDDDDDDDGWGDDDDDSRRAARYVDIYVAFEQSRVPFSGLADFENSSVQRARLDLQTRQIVDLKEVLPETAGFIRFCSAFMAGPQHGFDNYTFLLNEESNDQLTVPRRARYGADPSIAPNRQAGLAVYLDTETGRYDALEGHGRHNHENTVIIPGGWRRQLVSISGDDTFTSTSTAERPNLSQMYLHIARNDDAFLRDRGTLYGFRVTGTQAGAVDPRNAFNGANDYFDIAVGQTWRGEFIPVPENIANGDTASLPQDALEDWSNKNNIFQFIRIEDVAYDPDSPRTVYFTDTGNTRIYQDASTGRLRRLISSTDPLVPQSKSSNGRLFRMVFNASNPLVVDEFSIFADGGAPAVPGGSDAILPPPGHPAWRSPDNMDVGHDSIMVQEDASNAKIWRFALPGGPWSHVATVDQDQNPATSDPGESSGIVDASDWLGAGWWVLDVQSHNPSPFQASDFADFDPTVRTWTGPPGPAAGHQYQLRRENGQLLLMHIQGS